MKKKFITMALVFVMLFITTTTTFANVLTESNYPTENIDGLINTGNAYDLYVLFKATDSNYYIIGSRSTSDIVVLFDSVNGYYFKSSTNFVIHKYDATAKSWLSFDECDYCYNKVASWNGTLFVDFMCASNYDLTYNGEVFFQQTPLRKTTEQVQIVGGITAKQLQAPLMTILTSLLILVISSVILVVAFRKGWNLLLTVLKGA